MLAEVWMNPGHLIAWLLVGLIAGWAGSSIMGTGFGLLGDLILGLIGAFVGGLVVGAFTTTSTGFIGSIVVSIIGAIVVIAISRLVSGKGLSRRG